MARKEIEEMVPLAFTPHTPRDAAPPSAADPTPGERDPVRPERDTLRPARQAPHLTRDQDPVHPETRPVQADGEWLPPENLSAPPPRPGMSQLWVRTGIRGDDDMNNVSKHMRVGWLPRRADTVPVEHASPTIKEGQFAGCVGVHGVVLFEIPVERVRQQKKYYAEKSRQQVRAVDEDIFRAQSSQVPFFQKRDSVTTVGRKVVPAEDVTD